MLKISLMSCFICLRMFLPSLCLMTRDSGNSSDSCCPLYQSAPTTTALLRKHSTPRSTAWLKPLLISAQTLLEVLGSTLESCTTGITPDATIHLPLAP